MFKLLRLAIYAMVGYAVYTFITDVVNAAHKEEEPAPRRAGGNRPRAAIKPVQMTGARRGGGTGKTEQTQAADGATVRHRVGRGVV